MTRQQLRGLHSNCLSVTAQETCGKTAEVPYSLGGMRHPGRAITKYRATCHTLPPHRPLCFITPYLCTGAICAHNLQQRHDVSGGEEVGAQDAVSSRGLGAHLQRGGYTETAACDGQKLGLLPQRGPSPPAPM